MIRSVKTRWKILLPIAMAVMLAGSMAKADTVIDWNRKAGEILVDSGLGPLPVDRALAIVHASVYEAVNAITRRYPVSDVKLKAAPGASVDAAVAAAAVPARVRGDEVALAVDLPGGYAFLPATDYAAAADRKFEGLAAIDRTVEFLALDAIHIETAGIMHDAGLAGLGRLAGADD